MFAPILESNKDNYPSPKSTVREKLTSKKAQQFLTLVNKANLLPDILKDKKFLLSTGNPGFLVYNEYAFAIACRDFMTLQDTIRVFIITEKDDGTPNPRSYTEVASKVLKGYKNPKFLDGHAGDVMRNLASSMESFWTLQQALIDNNISWTAPVQITKRLALWGKENRLDSEKPGKKFDDSKIMKKGDLIEKPKKPRLNLTTRVLSLDNPEAINLARENYLIRDDEDIFLTDGKPGLLAHNDCCMAVLCNPRIVGDISYKPRHGHNMIKVAYSQMSNRKHRMLAWLSPVGLEPKIARNKIFQEAICKNMGSRANLEAKLTKKLGFHRNESNREAVDTLSFDW